MVVEGGDDGMEFMLVGLLACIKFNNPPLQDLDEVEEQIVVGLLLLPGCEPRVYRHYYFYLQNHSIFAHQHHSCLALTTYFITPFFCSVFSQGRQEAWSSRGSTSISVLKGLQGVRCNLFQSGSSLFILLRMARLRQASCRLLRVDVKEDTVRLTLRQWAFILSKTVEGSPNLYCSLCTIRSNQNLWNLLSFILAFYDLNSRIYQAETELSSVREVPQPRIELANSQIRMRWVGGTLT